MELCVVEEIEESTRELDVGDLEDVLVIGDEVGATFKLDELVLDELTSLELLKLSSKEEELESTVFELVERLLVFDELLNAEDFPEDDIGVEVFDDCDVEIVFGLEGRLLVLAELPMVDTFPEDDKELELLEAEEPIEITREFVLVTFFEEDVLVRVVVGGMTTDRQEHPLDTRDDGY
ncbi:uncharacterized protein LY89DRAFT_669161 [Mollisia scopiformis]|uniref:Uncharacterized protein n=1 Tax=Mollisia scopiformis TaxID=149040 RepID=A0A194X997_MOLSC|nr:uncharacterized protein LY89DRAFT_669161 [Mollisia scopiformis]KUJ16694.1 hypothetical protein LY89DRAFT_669161 [Mollisia scopiformis]